MTAPDIKTGCTFSTRSDKNRLTQIIINMRILIVLLLMSNITFGHTEKVIKIKYGNIDVTTIASDYVEEMNKTLIIAQYANMLSKELKYSGKVYLLFSEQQLENTSIKSWIPEADGSPETDGIHIMFRLKTFSIAGCLNVIENTLLNVKNLKKYRDKNFNIYSGKISQVVTKVLAEKIYRPNGIKELEKPELYSYYITNGEYNFFRKEASDEEKFAVLPNILDFQILSHDIVIVFKNAESFTIFKDKNPDRDVIIEEIPRYYWPYKVHLSGDYKIIIEFFRFSEQKNRVMIYYLDRNEFVQDIDKVLRK